MQIVAGLDAYRVFDIASELAITVGGTSKLVDRLQEAGHLRGGRTGRTGAPRSSSSPPRGGGS